MIGAATDFVRLGQLTEEKTQLEKQLEQLMDRYVYLEDLAEKIRSQE